jgi:hypothetical protein
MRKALKKKLLNSIIHILIPSSYLLSGGGDYRGIYDIGFKRGLYGVYRPFIECPLIG